MIVQITEYLRINLDRASSGSVVAARLVLATPADYKCGLFVYDRDPREIHRPLLDPARYERTYSPDPSWCRILEYYCPKCGTMMETEYLPPGHPPVRDIELDIDALRARWLKDDGTAATPAISDSAHEGDRADGKHRTEP